MRKRRCVHAEGRGAPSWRQFTFHGRDTKLRAPYIGVDIISNKLLLFLCIELGYANRTRYLARMELSSHVYAWAASSRLLPNLFLLGNPKSGSTFLFGCLRSSFCAEPCVQAPPPCPRGALASIRTCSPRWGLRRSSTSGDPRVSAGDWSGMPARRCR